MRSHQREVSSWISFRDLTMGRERQKLYAFVCSNFFCRTWHFHSSIGLGQFLYFLSPCEWRQKRELSFGRLPFNNFSQKCFDMTNVVVSHWWCSSGYLWCRCCKSVAQQICNTPTLYVISNRVSREKEVFCFFLCPLCT